MDLHPPGLIRNETRELTKAKLMPDMESLSEVFGTHHEKTRSSISNKSASPRRKRRIVKTSVSPLSTDLSGGLSQLYSPTKSQPKPTVDASLLSRDVAQPGGNNKEESESTAQSKSNLLALLLDEAGGDESSCRSDSENETQSVIQFDPFNAEKPYEHKLNENAELIDLIGDAQRHSGIVANSTALFNLLDSNTDLNYNEPGSPQRSPSRSRKADFPLSPRRHKSKEKSPRRPCNTKHSPKSPRRHKNDESKTKSPKKKASFDMPLWDGENDDKLEKKKKKSKKKSDKLHKSTSQLDYKEKKKTHHKSSSKDMHNSLKLCHLEEEKDRRKKKKKQKKSEDSSGNLSMSTNSLPTTTDSKELSTSSLPSVAVKEKKKKKRHPKKEHDDDRETTEDKSKRKKSRDKKRKDESSEPVQSSPSRSARKESEQAQPKDQDKESSMGPLECDSEGEADNDEEKKKRRDRKKHRKHKKKNDEHVLNNSKKDFDSSIGKDLYPDEENIDPTKEANTSSNTEGTTGELSGDLSYESDPETNQKDDKKDHSSKALHNRRRRSPRHVHGKAPKRPAKSMSPRKAPKHREKEEESEDIVPAQFDLANEIAEAKNEIDALELFDEPSQSEHEVDDENENDENDVGSKSPRRRVKAALGKYFGRNKKLPTESGLSVDTGPKQVVRTESESSNRSRLPFKFKLGRKQHSGSEELHDDDEDLLSICQND